MNGLATGEGGNEMRAKDLYSDALVLSEGRYEARERHREVPEVKVEENNKSRLVRLSENLVKRIAALNPVGEEV